ncbi:MAG TPA: hypothetical protein VLN59_08470 [Burkholderiales bacterium]|nr:hypothetical protein [Burkholderiales bacterium]
MSHLPNRVTVLLLRTLAVAIALAFAGCKDKTPPGPASPPKPKMQSNAVAPFAGLNALTTDERTGDTSSSSRRATSS